MSDSDPDVDSDGNGIPDDDKEFPKQTALWGPTVLAFLQRHGVKP